MIHSFLLFLQSKCEAEPEYTERLEEVSPLIYTVHYINTLYSKSKGRDMILDLAREIAETERLYGLDTSVEDYKKEFKFGLIEVVYKWAKGEVSNT